MLGYKERVSLIRAHKRVAEAGEKFFLRDLLEHDLLSTTLINVAAMGLGFLSSMLAARLLGPSGRGELSAILNWPLFLSGFGTFGVTVATAYYCGRYPADASRTISTAWIFLIALSFPLMALSYWLMPWLLQAQADSTIQSARVVLLLILVQFAGGLPYWVLQGMGNFKIWNAVRIQMPILWMIILLICMFTSTNSATLVAYGYIFAMMLHNVVWIFAMIRSVPGPYRPEFSRLRGLFRYGLPSMLTIIPQQLNLKLDQLLMAAILPAHTLGVYVVAVAWGSIFSPLLTSVSQVIFPHLAATHDRQTQAETLQRTLRLSVLSVTVLTGVLLAVTPIFLPLLFGKAFVAAVPPAFVLIVAAGAAGINQVAGEGLRGLGVPKWPMVAELVGLSITIILLALLLRRYQLMGAAIASLGSYLGTLITLVLLIGHQTQASPWKIVIPRRQDISFLWNQFYSFCPRLASLLYYNRK